MIGCESNPAYICHENMSYRAYIPTLYLLTLKLTQSVGVPWLDQFWEFGPFIISSLLLRKQRSKVIVFPSTDHAAGQTKKVLFARQKGETNEPGSSSSSSPFNLFFNCHSFPSALWTLELFGAFIYKYEDMNPVPSPPHFITYQRRHFCPPLTPVPTIVLRS